MGKNQSSKKEVLEETKKEKQITKEMTVEYPMKVNKFKNSQTVNKITINN